MRLLLKTTLLVISIISFSTAYAQQGITTVQSNYTVEETANRLENILKENGITIFSEIDHQQGASGVDMELLPTRLFIVGNPNLGTPIMQCSQTAAIDLPQKILIWKNSEGIVQIGYNNPDYLKNRHSITGCNDVLKKIGGALHNFVSSAADG
ncbi:MAG: DUF302 domain-containing protein [Balneolaceae bacterium]|nr:DUF302 domain-containing protein [Balneolaceae bacterium]